MEERERGRNPQTCVSQLSSFSSLVSAFIQGMTTPSKFEPDETDFNQIGANPIDLGIWEYSLFINYFYFLINKFDFYKIFDLSDKFIT